MITKCKICGKEYEKCKNCTDSEKKGIFHYKSVADSPECYKIYMTILDYSNKKADAKTTYERLKDIGIEEITFLPSISKVVKDITELAKNDIDNSKNSDIVDSTEELMNDTQKKEISRRSKRDKEE